MQKPTEDSLDSGCDLLSKAHNQLTTLPPVSSLWIKNSTFTKQLREALMIYEENGITEVVKKCIECVDSLFITND